MPGKNPVVALDAEDVRITTCTVTIKTLRVDSRQLTLAVFRQLPRMPLICPRTLELQGIPWGWVNYDTSSHYTKNFVIQKGQHLYRSEFWVDTWDAVFDECVGHRDNHQYGPPVSPLLRTFIRRNREALHVSDYAGRWDELMERLQSIEQLYIAA